MVYGVLGCLAAMVLLALCYSVRRALLASLRKSAAAEIRLLVRARDPGALEMTVRALRPLCRERLPGAVIGIDLEGADREYCQTAALLAAEDPGTVLWQQQ